MLASFEPEELPGIHPARLFPLMDIGSYRDAWTAVKQVSSYCISPFLSTNETSNPADSDAVNFVSETGYSDFGKSTRSTILRFRFPSFLQALLMSEMMR